MDNNLYIPPSKEVTEQIMTLFALWKNKTITKDELIEALNLLQDENKICTQDREVLGWKIVFG